MFFWMFRGVSLGKLAFLILEFLKRKEMGAQRYGVISDSGLTAAGPRAEPVCNSAISLRILAIKSFMVWETNCRQGRTIRKGYRGKETHVMIVM